MDIGLNICIESRYAPIKAITDNPSSIEIIISASCEIQKHNLFGALNIHMDKEYGLTVLINEQHPKRSMIEAVKVFCYYPESSSKSEQLIESFSPEEIKNEAQNASNSGLNYDSDTYNTLLFGGRIMNKNFKKTENRDDEGFFTEWV